jgi:hypothetical protein
MTLSEPPHNSFASQKVASLKENLPRTFFKAATLKCFGPDCATRSSDLDIAGATDVSGLSLPDDGNLAAAGIRPVVKDDANVFIDLAAQTILPNGNQVEKWEGLAIGPRLDMKPSTVMQTWSTRGLFHRARRAL